MLKFLNRLVSLVLVSALLVDPALAGSLHFPTVDARPAAAQVFTVQALASRPATIALHRKDPASLIFGWVSRRLKPILIPAMTLGLMAIAGSVSQTPLHAQALSEIHAKTDWVPAKNKQIALSALMDIEQLQASEVRLVDAWIPGENPDDFLLVFKRLPATETQTPMEVYVSRDGKTVRYNGKRYPNWVPAKIKDIALLVIETEEPLKRSEVHVADAWTNGSDDYVLVLEQLPTTDSDRMVVVISQNGKTAHYKGTSYSITSSPQKSATEPDIRQAVPDVTAPAPEPEAAPQPPKPSAGPKESSTPESVLVTLARRIGLWGLISSLLASFTLWAAISELVRYLRRRRASRISTPPVPAILIPPAPPPQHEVDNRTRTGIAVAVYDRAFAAWLSGQPADLDEEPAAKGPSMTEQFHLSGTFMIPAVGSVSLKQVRKRVKEEIKKRNGTSWLHVNYVKHHFVVTSDVQPVLLRPEDDERKSLNLQAQLASALDALLGRGSPSIPPLDPLASWFFKLDDLAKLREYVDSDFWRDIVREMGEKNSPADLTELVRRYLTRVYNFELSNDSVKALQALHELGDNHYKFAKAVELGRVKLVSEGKLFWDEAKPIPSLHPEDYDFLVAKPHLLETEDQFIRDFLKYQSESADSPPPADGKSPLFIYHRIWKGPNGRWVILVGRDGYLELYYSSITYSAVAGELQWERQEGVMAYLDDQGRVRLGWFMKPKVENAHELSDAASQKINAVLAAAVQRGEVEIPQPGQPEETEDVALLHVKLGLAFGIDGEAMSLDPFGNPQYGNPMKLRLDGRRYPAWAGEALDLLRRRPRDQELRHLWSEYPLNPIHYSRERSFLKPREKISNAWPSLGLTQEGTTEKLAAWAKHGNWAQRAIANYLPGFGVFLIEDVGITSGHRTHWWQAVLQGRILISIVGALSVPLLIAHSPAELIPMAVVMALWLLYQIQFVTYHDNTSRSQIVARLLGTLLLNGTAYGIARHFATQLPNFSQHPVHYILAVVLAALGGLIGSGTAHALWNRVWRKLGREDLLLNQDNRSRPDIPYRWNDGYTRYGRLRDIHRRLISSWLSTGYGNRGQLTVVDFGIGNGGAPETLALIKSLGDSFPKVRVRVIAVDQEPAYVANARAAYNQLYFAPRHVSVEFVQSGYDLLEKNIKNVDFIVAANVLRFYDLVEQSRIILQLSRSLAVDGALYVIRGSDGPYTGATIKIYNSSGESADKFLTQEGTIDLLQSWAIRGDFWQRWIARHLPGLGVFLIEDFGMVSGFRTSWFHAFLQGRIPTALFSALLVHVAAAGWSPLLVTLVSLTGVALLFFQTQFVTFHDGVAPADGRGIVRWLGNIFILNGAAFGIARYAATALSPYGEDPAASLFMIAIAALGGLITSGILHDLWNHFWWALELEKFTLTQNPGGVPTGLLAEIPQEFIADFLKRIADNKEISYDDFRGYLQRWILRGSKEAKILRNYLTNRLELIPTLEVRLQGKRFSRIKPRMGDRLGLWDRSAPEMEQEGKIPSGLPSLRIETLDLNAPPYPGDMDRLMELYGLLTGDKESDHEEQLMQDWRSTDKPHRVWVARDGQDRIQGYIMVMPDPEMPSGVMIIDVAVDNLFQGQRWGTTLIERSMRDLLTDPDLKSISITDASDDGYTARIVTQSLPPDLRFKQVEPLSRNHYVWRRAERSDEPSSKSTTGFLTGSMFSPSLTKKRPLSLRERQFLEGLYRGWTLDEIAQDLGISWRGVKNLLASVRRKFQQAGLVQTGKLDADSLRELTIPRSPAVDKMPSDLSGAQDAASPARAITPEPISPEQRQGIIEWAAQGFHNQEIARRVGLSPDAVGGLLYKIAAERGLKHRRESFRAQLFLHGMVAFRLSGDALRTLLKPVASSFNPEWKLLLDTVINGADSNRAIGLRIGHSDIWVRKRINNITAFLREQFTLEYPMDFWLFAGLIKEPTDKTHDGSVGGDGETILSAFVVTQVPGFYELWDPLHRLFLAHSILIWTAGFIAAAFIRVWYSRVSTRHFSLQSA